MRKYIDYLKKQHAYLEEHYRGPLYLASFIGCVLIMITFSIIIPAETHVVVPSIAYPSAGLAIYYIRKYIK